MNTKRNHLFVFLLAAFFLLAGNVQAQSLKITGTVSEVSGEPIPGASVSIKGTNFGTATDADGHFSLMYDARNPILVVSFLGYERQEITLGNRTTLNVTLTEDAEALDEVVAVGYGSQRKVTVTGAVSAITAKDLGTAKLTTTAAALVGKVPGITTRQVNGQPGQVTRMEIRNLGSPLYVIDGVMKDEGQFNNIDVNDIESISILKDGAAAIYGVKAANGVVLVTTKGGHLNEKPTISLNAYYGIQNWTRFPEFSNASEYMTARTEAIMNTNGATSSQMTTAEELEKWRQQYYNPETGEDYRSFDWYDFAVRKNAPQRYLSVSSTGGSDRTTYYFSISNLNQKAAFRDFEFDRKNFQANVDTRITAGLKLGMKINGRIESRYSPTVGSSYSDDYWRMRWGLNQNKPTERAYANDNPNYIAKTYNSLTNEAYGRRDIAGTRDDVWRVFQGNWDLEWKTPLKGLTVAGMYSYYFANEQEEANKKYVSFYTYDALTDTYSTTDKDNAGSAALTKKQNSIWENVFRASITYDNKFGDHRLHATLIAEATERVSKYQTITNEAIPHNFYNLFDTTSEDNKITKDTYSEVPTAGFIGRINYNYKDRYILELSGRYDGCFKFPKENNKRWGFFPSVSGAWRISQEPFFENSGMGRVFSDLKIRASYGQMGDQDATGIGSYDYLTGYTMNSTSAVISSNPFNTASSGTVATITMNGLPITNVTWVTTSMADVGINMGFLENRLTAEVDGFYRKRSGLTDTRSDVVLPLETGYTLPIENLNTDMHMGIDGEIKWHDRVGDFSYFAGVNGTLARKKDGETYGESWGNSWAQYRGSTYNRWAYVSWGYEVIGRFETQEQIDDYPVIMCLSNGSDRNIPVLPGDFIYKDQNNDGVINDYDARPIGYAQGGLPYVTFGINMGVDWKGIDLTVDFSGATMQSYQQNYETKWPFQADGNTFTFMASNSWHHVDPTDPTSAWVAGDYPALRLTPTDAWHVYCNNSTYWMTNVTYLRLRNVELGYTLPKSWTERIYIQRCRFYFNGTNLFSLDNISRLGLDPENNDSNGLGYPNNRVLTLGVNITF